MGKTAVKAGHVIVEGQAYRWKAGDELPDEVAKHIANTAVFADEVSNEEVEEFFAAAGRATADARTYEPPHEPDDDYDTMKVQELKDELDDRGVEYESDAKKRDLVNALRQHDRARSAGVAGPDEHTPENQKEPGPPAQTGSRAGRGHRAAHA